MTIAGDSPKQTAGHRTDVIIVGTGFAGIGLATRLRRSGCDSFVLLERADDVGGTWRDNHYPGAACDVSSHLYSFSFRPNPDWTFAYSPQAEILQYLRDMAKDEGLTEHIRFGREVLDAIWVEEQGEWVVTTTSGTFVGRSLVTATGHLSDPKFPEIDGLESFEGALFHSAAWDHGVELNGRRIGVLGTGASAIQVVPEMAKIASDLTVFQRSAPYVRPRVNRPYTDAERRTFRRAPATMRSLRQELFWANEARLVERQSVPALLERAATEAHRHREAQINDPVLAERLKPNFVYGCKRGLKSNDYYPTFNLHHVNLQDSGIDRVEGKTIVCQDDSRHQIDVLVACTGFKATDLPIAHRITGAGGQRLSDAWAKGMQAYATVSVHGFPNLFIMGGPNTGLGHNSAIYVIESQIDFIVGGIDFLAQHPGVDVDVDADAEDAFVADLEWRGEGTVWLSEGCHTWYVDPRNGRLTSLWPDFAHSFRRENARFTLDAYTVRNVQQ